jgi:UDP-N-acetylmuramoyl-L-alanyl-D-glutamate--2,6-diaminopimelate ligase
VVLILGKGDEPYQIIYDKKFPLVDKEEVLKHI